LLDALLNVSVVVMSHGTQNKIYARDAPYQTEELWKPFIAKKCRTLAGKPKLFFIQVCQKLYAIVSHATAARSRYTADEIPTCKYLL
jgi:caspase-like apoptosis-related cysteine protease